MKKKHIDILKTIRIGDAHLENSTKFVISDKLKKMTDDMMQELFICGGVSYATLTYYLNKEKIEENYKN